MSPSALTPEVQAASASGNITTSSTVNQDVVVGAVTPYDQTAFMPPIKNQGNCGSCWAFATNALIESGIKKKNGTSYNFAEQELVDCCKKPYTVCSVGGGCSGGNTEQALTYVSKWGIAFTSVYPYLAVQGACKNSTTARNKVVSATAPVTYIARGSISALQASLQSKPTAVSVDASSWPGYSSGIFNYCTYTSLNHENSRGVAAGGCHPAAGEHDLLLQYHTQRG